jgi:hypothetical protein
LSKNCLQLKSAGQQISAAVQAAVASGSTSAVAKEVDLFKALAAAAPSEIRADVETVANAYATAATALAKVHFTPGQTPTPKQIAELQAVGKSFNVAKVEAAGKRLETWGKSHCGG